MRTLIIAAAMAVAATPSGAIAARHGGMTKGVANAVLAAQGGRTPVKLIDYDQDRCDPRTVDQWLRDLGGANIRAIVWTGGPCDLVGPGIDSGSDWCAQATVTLVHPKDRHDRPEIEIFFEAPKHGQPGVAYAFRGEMQAADGGDMTRFRKDFEGDWTSRFPAANAAIDCPDAEQ
jgi:hypothetical protein